MSALHEDLKGKIKEELIYLAVLFVSLVIILKIALFNEAIMPILKLSISIFLLFVLPGFFFMYIWHDKLDFIERAIISIPLSSALIGLSSYNLALLSVNVKYHIFILPALFLLLSFLFLEFLHRKSNNCQ